MKRVLSLLVDLLLLAASLSTGVRLGDAIQVVALVIAGVAVALALALCVLMAILLVDQRKPPYIEGIR